MGWRLWLGGAGAVFALAPAAAQEAAGTLETVVVTPTPGVAQRAFDSPASVDAITGAVLRDGQLQVNLSETLARVPGVTALNRQNYAQDLQVSIRGFGARSTFGVRGLRLFADGIPATAPDGQGQVAHFDLASADRIEVLRGPFSALYGNSSGGVLSIFTADGGPGHEVELATAFGSDDVRRHTARLSGAAGDWSWNVSALRFATDGLRAHSAAERRGFNGKWRWRASEDTRWTFVLNHLDLPRAQDPLGLAREELDADPRQASPAALQFNTRKSVEQLQAGAILEHRLDAAQSLKLTAWRGSRDTRQFQSIPVAAQAAPTHAGGVIDLARDYQGLDAQWTGQRRLGEGLFTLTAGVTADELAEHRRGFENFVGPTPGVQGALRRDEDNRVRSFDQYAQAHWAGERVSLTAGLRHSRIRFASRDRYTAPGNGDDSGAVRHGAVTPALGVVWHVHETLNVYAAAGRGFETPTFNELSYRPGGQPGLNLDLRPASSRQWELGVKARPWPRWQLEAALFHARTADEIVVLGNSGGRSTFQNAGQTRRRGVEAGVAGAWGEGWSLRVAASWLDARYAGDFLTCGPPPCTTPSVVVPAGRRLPGTARSSAFAQLAWGHRPWGLEAALEWRHIGRIAVDDRNTGFAPSSQLWNLRVALAQQWGGWQLREFVRLDNLAGRSHVGSVIVNEGNRRFFEPGPGRQWLVGLSAARPF